MSDTLLPDTLDYLVALFTNASTLGGADPAIQVIDGPMPDSGSLPRALWVGVDDIHNMTLGDATLAGDGAKARNDFSQGRQETITVHCIASAWGGSTSAGYSPLRAVAKTIIDAAEALVISDRANAPAFNQTPGVETGEWWQEPMNGLRVYVPFQIIYLAL